MKTKTLNPKALVKVVAVKPRAQVPYDFPWLNYVSVALQGDLAKLETIQNELNEIKKLVNADISKFGLNLKDYKIEISWLDEI